MPDAAAPPAADLPAALTPALGVVEPLEGAAAPPTDAPPIDASTGLAEAARLFADAVAAGLIPPVRAGEACGRTTAAASTMPHPSSTVAPSRARTPPSIRRRRSRLAPVMAAGAGTVAAVLVAVVVLVVLRMPDAAGSRGPLAPLDAAVARALLADRVLSVATWIGYVATTLVVGGALFRAFVGRPTRAGRGASERLLLAAAAAGIVAGAASLALRTMVLADGRIDAVGDVEVIRVVATSTFGDAACLRLLALAMFALVLARPPRGWERRLRVIRPSGTLLVFGSIARVTVERVAFVVAGLVAVASFTCIGHPQATDPRGLLVLAQGVHVGAASVWFGGGVLLAVEIRGQRRHGTADCSARTVARFSVLAGVAVAVVGITGAILGASQLASPGALVATAYGRALTAKLALVGLVVALGTYNHVRLVPAVVAAGEDRAWRRLGTTAAAEGVIIAAGVLVATAAMTSGGL